MILKIIYLNFSSKIIMLRNLYKLSFYVDVIIYRDLQKTVIPTAALIEWKS